jgi:hypothetical protein
VKKLMSQQDLFDREEPPSSRGRLVRRIGHLADEVLPRRARSAGADEGTRKSEKNEYPVQEDHCFRRIAYDAAVGGQWDEAVPRPFEKHANARQLRNALEALEQMARNASRAHRLNRQSLRHRKENAQ